MKLKFKPNWRQIGILAVIVVAVLGLLAHRSTGKTDGPGGLDADARKACGDFAAGYSHARNTPARLRLADQVMASSQHTDNDEIAERAAEMGRSADDSTTAWRTASVALTKACHDAGWTAGSVS